MSLDVIALGTANKAIRTKDTRGEKLAVKLNVVDVNADARLYWNFTQTIQEGVVTFTEPSTGIEHEFFVYTASNQKAYIKHRTVNPDTPWIEFSLSDISGGPLANYTQEDLHNNYSLVVDTDGHLHVAGNMHGTELRYVKSTNPLDITSWTTPGMGADMTGGLFFSYPRFLRLDGKLVFSFRQGASGNGDVYFKYLNEDTGVWANKVRVLDGTTGAPTQSAYFGRQVVGPDGWVHAFYIWAPDYQKIHYIKSPDGLVWYDVDGNLLPLPIRPEGQTNGTEPVWETGGDLGQQGFINACPTWVDAQGHPHTVNLIPVLRDGVWNRQLAHYWHDGEEWQTQILTSHFESGTPAGGGTVGAQTGQVTSPMIFGARDGRIYVVYTHRLDGERGSIWAIDVSHPFQKFAIANLESHWSDFTYDSRALKEHNELKFVWSATVADFGTSPGGAYGSALPGGFVSMPQTGSWIGRWAGTWSAGTAYVINDLVPRSGTVYKRIVDGTTAGTPESDPTNWSQVTWAIGDGIHAQGLVSNAGSESPATTTRTFVRKTSGTASGAVIKDDTTNWATGSLDDSFGAQPLAVITVDLNQMSKLQAGSAKLPYVKQIGQISTGPQSISAGSWGTNVPGTSAFLTPPELRGKDSQFIGPWIASTTYAIGDVVTTGNFARQYRDRIGGASTVSPELDTSGRWELNTGKGAAVMVRVRARGQSGKAGRTTLIRVAEREQGSSNGRYFATVAFVDSSSSSLRQTPWVPCKFGPFTGKDGELYLEGRQLGGGGTNNLIALTAEIGVLAGPGTDIE